MLALEELIGEARSD